MPRARSNHEDQWMPDRVYRGKSSYEYHPRDGGSIALCPESSTREEVMAAHQSLMLEFSGASPRILSSRTVLKEQRRRRMSDARQAKTGTEKVRAALYKQMLLLFSAARSRGIASGKGYEITETEIHEIIDKANWRCELTGIPFEIGRRGCTFGPFRPSLDRIDSSKGYTMDNVRLVCTAANLAMNQWGEEAFKRVAIGYILRNVS